MSCRKGASVVHEGLTPEPAPILYTVIGTAELADIDELLPAAWAENQAKKPAA
jgi:hypothetical protein